MSLALSNAPALRALATGPMLRMLEEQVPGFGVLQKFFKQWLKIDLTTVAVFLTIFGTVKTGAGAVRNISEQLWRYVTRFFLSSISVSGQDKLNEEVLYWVSQKILPQRQPRMLVAQCQQSSGSKYRVLETANQTNAKRQHSIYYAPCFENIWFIHDRNIFIVRRVGGGYQTRFSKVPTGNESLKVMCLGRSPEPIKRFFEKARKFLEDRSQKYIRIFEPMGPYFEAWASPDLQTRRPIESVHMNGDSKADLLADLDNYNSQECREFYKSRDIPYRRGYLLHGPPGTGKTSTCIALASYYEAELYLLHLPRLEDDEQLGTLFKSLPKRCFLVLEDIDAVGIQKRRSGKKVVRGHEGCTLSGLLNVLDGVSSSEGRIILMTTNHIENLDPALIRPGRIDKMVYMGKVERPMAKEMFMRFFKPDEQTPDTTADDRTTDSTGDTVLEEIERLADKFVANFPEDEVSPAQLQGYLVRHRGSPDAAIAGLEVWAANAVAEEKARAEELEAIREAEEESDSETETKQVKKAKKEKKGEQKSDGNKDKHNDDKKPEAKTEKEPESNGSDKQDGDKETEAKNDSIQLAAAGESGEKQMSSSEQNKPDTSTSELQAVVVEEPNETSASDLGSTPESTEVASSASSSTD